jgi:hypothetical protein
MQWDYEVIRMDTLDLFKLHLELAGNRGWEAISANYVMHAPEKLESGEIVEARPVWIAVLKRAKE